MVAQINYQLFYFVAWQNYFTEEILIDDEFLVYNCSCWTI